MTSPEPTPHPSPRPYPSADASNVLHRPSGASIRDFAKSTLESGVSIKLTPAANAMWHSRARKLCTA